MMLCGEHPRYTFDDFLRHVNLAAEYKAENGSNIRRINVEIPPLSQSDLRRLKQEGKKVGTFVTFQETYNEEAYKKYH